MGKYYVPGGNWTNRVLTFLGIGSISSKTFTVSQIPKDPAPDCQKDFESYYACGNDKNLKRVLVGREANGQGAYYNCVAESTQCDNLKLTLSDDAKLTLTNLDGTKTFWTSSSPGLSNVLASSAQLNLPDDNNKPLTIPAYAADGIARAGDPTSLTAGPGRRFPRNYLLPGEMLAFGQWIGSPSGTCRLIMGTDEEPYTLQVVTNILGCNSIDNNTIAEPNAARLYTMPKIYNENVGKVGYVNNLGQLQMYPNDMTYYNTIFELISPADGSSGYNIDGARIGTAVPATDAVDCQKKCTMGPSDAAGTQACAGVIFDNRATTVNKCQLLSSEMYRQHRIIDKNKNYQYYIRQKNVTGQDISCPVEVTDVSGGFWNSFDMSGNMAPSTKCGLANYVEAERKKVKDDLPDVYKNLQYKDASGNVQNYSFSDANTNANKNGFKYWYESLQNKYRQLKGGIIISDASLNSTFNELEASRKNLADWTGEQLQNLVAMNEDRDLNMMSQNYRHIMWSILAILIIIGTIKFTKSSAKSSSGSSTTK